MSPSPNVKVNNTLVNAVAYDALKGSATTIQLADLSGVSSWSLVCVATDGYLDPATVTSSLVLDNVLKTATFNAPINPAALIFESKVNNGININGMLDPSYTQRFEIHVRNGAGKRLLALGESTESNAATGWTHKLNALASPGSFHTVTITGDTTLTRYQAEGSIIRLTGTPSANFNLTFDLLDSWQKTIKNDTLKQVTILPGGGTIAANNSSVAISDASTVYVANMGGSGGKTPASDDGYVVGKWFVDEDTMDDNAYGFIAGTNFLNRASNGVSAPLVSVSTANISASVFGGNYRSVRVTDPSQGFIGAQAVALPNTFTISAFVNFRPQPNGNVNGLLCPIIARLNTTSPVAINSSDASYDFYIAVTAASMAGGSPLDTTFFLRTTSGTYKYKFSFGGSGVGNSGAYAVIPFFEKSHVCCTYDGTTFRFFMNGAAIDSTPATGVAPTNTANHRWLIGSNVGSSTVSRICPGNYEQIVIRNGVASLGQIRREAIAGLGT